MTDMSVTNDVSLAAALVRRGRLGGPAPVWTPHPKLAGVRLSRLVDGADSDGALATLLVSLDAGAAMAPHSHENETEQHIVLDGEGILRLDGETHAYRPGQLAIIPRGHEHSVIAGVDGMVLLAVFSPAPRR